ncbi:hypothetical protein M2352_003142 [Azospirillum fermentarium]|uniref:hypothetical protein n=1 Tax=Azospirillum fermentarium TaxID=1233114 RepID=UPI0022279085|nr:hypothetical protein [Azospirillum fermentarium]MCW2247508.1 hypothetical protein [Azospirillum fermentarium]
MTRLIRSAAVFLAVSLPGLAAAQQLPLPREPGAYQAPQLYDEMGRPNLPQVGGGAAAAPAPSHWNAMGRDAQFRAGMQRYGTDGRRSYSRTHSLSNLPPAATARAAPVRPGAPPRAPWETR